MADRYEPASDFLKAVIAEDAPLTGNEFADANRSAVIALMKDADCSNRDWATFLIAQLELDTPDIRRALVEAATLDANEDVRGEALVGLAQRDPKLALPLVRKELTRESVSVNTFEAAEILADPSLVDALSCFQDPSGDAYLDSKAEQALKACLDAHNDTAAVRADRMEE